MSHPINIPSIDDLLGNVFRGDVVTVTRGKDRLIGGPGDESFWGGFSKDIIRAGAGSGDALGGRGNDLADAGEGQVR